MKTNKYVLLTVGVLYPIVDYNIADSKDYDRILDMLKSQDKDSYKLALGILRSNNCIIYEKRT